MQKKAKIVTLITESQARVGHIFSIVVTKKCLSCKLFDICIGKLRPGIPYKIVEVRKMKHYCPLIKDYMKVVLVEPQTLQVAIESKKAVEGLIVEYNKNRCNNKSCRYWKYCYKEFIENGAKLKITKINAKIHCPLGFHLTLVEASPYYLPFQFHQ